MQQDVYICVGFPESVFHVANFVKVSTGKLSAKDAAKKLRKDVAENPREFSIFNRPHIAPAELYWAVFDSLMADKPILASDNFWARDALRKEAEEKAKQKLAARAIKMVEMEIHKGKCPNCGCYALADGTCSACGANICTECFGVLDEGYQCWNCGLGVTHDS